MKAIKISDDIHSKLTGLLGELTAETNKMQTYQDAINALLSSQLFFRLKSLPEWKTSLKKTKTRASPTKRTLSVMLYATGLND